MPYYSTKNELVQSTFIQANQLLFDRIRVGIVGTNVGVACRNWEAGSGRLMACDGLRGLGSGGSGGGSGNKNGQSEDANG
jgi:hypothetical protein